MSQFRYIDTSGLPPGFDIADLVEQGITGDALVAWCKQRVRDGIPPKPGPVAVKEKPPAAGGSQRPGAESAQKPGTETAQAKPTAERAAKSTPVAGNVVAMRKPEPEPELSMPPEYSDDALADTFSAKYGDSLAYVNTWGRWMLWDGKQWAHDETLRTRDLARQVARSVAAEAVTRVDLGRKAASIANSISSARTIGSIEQLARSDRRHAATAEQWDQDLWALNTPGGIVDLQTGQLRPARREDFATKVTRATPGGSCPTWLEFLKVATDGDAELVEFLRRMVGYCLTGITREHALFFVYGSGGNGKGTFLNTIDWIMASYAKAANMEMFIEQKYASHPTDVAGLMGARMVTAQETQEGKRWDEQRLKAFTGGDPITARFMRQDEFTYIPQFKLVFAGNHKPMLRNVDEAIKRRLYLIPFTVTIPASRRDPGLAQKLRMEADGILQWAVDGCLDWQNSMLAPPERVLATTEEYFDEQDVMAQFFDECVEPNRLFSVKASVMYERYAKWMEAMGEYVLPRRRFTLALANRGISVARINGNNLVEGMRLKDDGPSTRRSEGPDQGGWGFDPRD